MTEEISREAIVAAAKDSTWALLANLEAVELYDPGVEHAFFVSNQHQGPGAARQCDLADGTYVKERIVDWRDGEGYEIEVYEDTTNDFPFTDQRVRFSVRAEGAGTLVRMTYSYAPKAESGLDRVQAAAIADEVVTGVLSGLQNFIQTGQRRETG